VLTEEGKTEQVSLAKQATHWPKQKPEGDNSASRYLIYSKCTTGKAERIK
jgi:hypothetical protein